MNYTGGTPKVGEGGRRWAKPGEARSKKPKYKEGDRVRIYKYKNKFEKGYKGYWTKEIFKISKVLTHKNPIKYEIIDLDNEPVLGRFYETELQRSWF